ncbi:cyclic pyranopterin monophosphate synthase subunit MoaC [Luteibacter rhizovicinus]|uniref:Cyclic pyranopterin monophosphate synthase subunit MoaC n=1 Tax=Luteibacter rhizovicinus TaxID=242606 RepID=A0A4V2W3G9_9GAMM|nr:bifunctional molybdenum cofactor biosynthesis protein MoaC/MoaB [Luteibacter rhizovicinus]TCV91889.1 cyclic pyranopterin monophosphate synthase subunit MoaC [Luteibacter rhizovicinus]
MKDVSQKPDSLRKARATATLHAPASCIDLLRSGETEKGDPLKTARVAGILAAKRTDELIPLCHPLPIHRADISYELAQTHVRVIAEVQTIGPTGVEMEALVAASMAALTLYDMLKPYAEPEDLHIEDCRLERKIGGKSHFRRQLASPRSAAVVVLSDTVASGAKSDTAGASVRASLENAGFAPVDYAILPDAADKLHDHLRELIDRGVDLVVTVGGTGLGPRDVTIDVVRPLIDVDIPGIMETARAFGQQRMPYAMLSRGIAGYARETLILTFPGSRAGAEESLAAVLPGIVHLVETGRSGGTHPGGYGEAH